MRDIENTIGNLVDHAKTVYLSSVDEDGFPNTRALLSVREREGIRTFYHSTNTSSQKVKQFLANPKACLYVCDHRFYRGVMLLGTVEVLTDAESRNRIWRRGDTMYYPEGVDDPDYTVLRFTATKARYYHNFKTEEFQID